MKDNGQLKALAEGRLAPLLLHLAWPSLVSMTLNALYNVVDRAFIGQGCGKEALSAITLTFPLVMLFAAFGIWIGLGHGAVLSIKLGEKDRVAAEKTLGQTEFLNFRL